MTFSKREGLFGAEFLTGETTSLYRESILKALNTLHVCSPSSPYSGKSAAELAELLKGEALPAVESSLEEALEKLRPVIANSVALSHPNTIAHLHCPPLVASLVGEVILCALNQSMDSFDQAPAATMLELAMSQWICAETGLPASSAAIFTAGATQSNFMALLLARDIAIQSRWNRNVQRDGLPPEASRLRFLCSEIAHFTVEKSAYQLGLGTAAVLKISVDAKFRMIPEALAESLEQLRKNELIPAAVVATAGTTDFGSIDPLPEIATLTRDAGARFHVDAAYGAALLLSERHRNALRGIEQADSVSMDFHKGFWQTISCGAFAVREAAHFRNLEVHADYLNPESHDASGIPNLVNRSLSTTRRFDALKLWLSFQLLGRKKFGAMIDRTVELAVYAGGLIRQTPRLEVLHEPEYGCLVFRYRPSRVGVDEDALNATLRQRLFDRGLAVLGHTRVRGRQCLKFTFMNPATSEEDIAKLIRLIVAEGNQLELE